MMVKDLTWYLLQKTDSLRKEIKKACTRSGNDSWLFIPKQRKNKVCLVAHIDTAQRENWGKKTIVHDKDQGILWSPEGLSADDRAGVWAVLHLYKTVPPEHQPYILLTDKEERGGIGATEAVDIFGDILGSDAVSHFIEIDRRGANDAVFYNNEPEEFRRYVTLFGFEEAHGTFSDISILGFEFEKCGVNLSAGYYNEHTPRELLNTKHLENTVANVRLMLEDNARNPELWPNPSEKTRDFKNDKFDF